LSVAHDVLSLETPAITSLHVMLVSFIFHSKLICKKVNDFFPPWQEEEESKANQAGSAALRKLSFPFGGIVISDSIQV